MKKMNFRKALAAVLVAAAVSTSAACGSGAEPGQLVTQSQPDEQPTGQATETALARDNSTDNGTTAEQNHPLAEEPSSESASEKAKRLMELGPATATPLPPTRTPTPYPNYLIRQAELWYALYDPILKPYLEIPPDAFNWMRTAEGCTFGKAEINRIYPSHRTPVRNHPVFFEQAAKVFNEKPEGPTGMGGLSTEHRSATNTNF